MTLVWVGVLLRIYHETLLESRGAARLRPEPSA